MARHTAKSHKIRKVEILVIQISNLHKLVWQIGSVAVKLKFKLISQDKIDALHRHGSML